MSRKLSRYFGLMLLLTVVCSGVSVYATVPISGDRKEVDPQFGQRRNEKDPDEIKREKDMAKARMKQRYTDLKRDTEQLLELATELKQYVDKAGENVLSLDVIRKCEQIEKLSKKIRQNMKGE